MNRWPILDLECEAGLFGLLQDGVDPIGIGLLDAVLVAVPAAVLVVAHALLEDVLVERGVAVVGPLEDLLQHRLHAFVLNDARRGGGAGRG
eukprot:796843-Alexandrium_andersonii.AAC.1